MSEHDHDIAPDVPRRRILQGMGGAGAVSLAGCIGGNKGDKGKGKKVYEDGKLNLAQVKSPIEFDPIVLNDVPSAIVAARIFEGLLTYDKKTGHVPDLAKKMPKVSNGGTTYEVQLKSGAKFQNGDKVTAEDVKYSLLAPVKEKTQNASELNMIKGIKVVDDTTAEINLKYPYGPFLHSLHMNIVPKSVREKNKKKFNKKNPVGSGQFKFDDWKQGQFVRLKRWNDYWGKPKADLKTVEYKPVKKATTRWTTLKNGKNDVMQEIPPNLWGTVKKNKKADIQSEPGISYFYLAMNCKEGPTTSRKVREAVDYCFSMDQAVSNFVTPTGSRQYSPLPRPVAKSWDMPLDKWKNIPHDKNIDKAKQLFEEAGVPKDYSWRIIVPPDDKREQIGITVANGLKNAGFENVSTKRYNWSKFLKLYITGNEEDYNMFTLGWAGTPDPDAFTYYLLSRADSVLGVTNGCFWGAHSQKGKKASQKFIKARKMADRDKRQKLYEEGITMALNARAHIPAYNLKNSWGVRDYVHDFAAHSVNFMRLSTQFNNAWVEEGK